ncbi:MAG: CRISPR-associated helicase Cas3' [Anaerolineales bacterium]|nr:CRISPR-associated helicase Cas3' [Anaerolineales bacterium]
MGHAMTKNERLEQMKWLYFQRAYSDEEMAQVLQVNRTTVYRDRLELETEYMMIEVQPGRFKLDPRQNLATLKPTLEEALALYLAGRRFSQRTQIAFQHTASGLAKLALAMRNPMAEKLVKSASELLARGEDADRGRILSTLAEAWVQRLRLRLHYQGLGGTRVREYIVSPYLIEPSPWGDGIYLIGPAEPHKKMATFKVERIQAAYIMTEEFQIPENFDERDLLQHAWGIWHEDRQPIMVRLKFASGRAARRLQESRWHPSEKVTVLADGSCEWEAQVSEWQEMLPWVRGWGADVEVLEPEELRMALTREAQRLAQLYKIIPQDDFSRMYFAHSKEGVSKAEWQRLKDHLTNTANLAFELGKDAGVSELAYVAGMLHDIGKYSRAFQRRLEGNRQVVDHATAGAREIIRLFPNEPQKTFAQILSYSLAGHHSGLPDYGDPTDLDTDTTLFARLNRKKLEDYSAYQGEVNLSELTFKPLRLKPIPEYKKFSVSFLARMVYSTLVDADWLDTETYMNGGRKPRGDYASIEALCRQFNEYLSRFDNPTNAINEKRSQILQACLQKAGEKPGLFTLTVPTGGGKTMASMGFALNHAAVHGLKRVIYVIPFTSIIEQNAGEFKKSLGEDHVLEHHSNFDWEKKRQAVDDETNKAIEKLKLASENWDIPIIVTTNVQFFESLFASKKTASRKIHNLAKSVIIFDEAQMLPREYLQPCMLAVQELVQNYGASAVFCTATQPLLKQFMPGAEEAIELAPDPQGLYSFFRRVEVSGMGRLPDEELLERLSTHEQVLCIVNTRKHAKGLFAGLQGDGRFHLSTLMCPAHRKKTLEEIRNRLKEGLPCRVVSTQVLEAGIDVDFPVGYRALAGLDSVIQAAGRVNREGNQSKGTLHVFEPVTEFIKRTPAYIQQTGDIARGILRDYQEDPASIEAIQAYFERVDSSQDLSRTTDVQRILDCFNRVEGFQFKTAAEKFKIIDENTVSVIIPYSEEAERLLDELKCATYPAPILRQLQLFTVNIYENEFQALQSLGEIEFIVDVYAALRTLDYYDLHTGINIPAQARGDAVFID